jgi:hypothetical protein
MEILVWVCVWWNGVGLAGNFGPTDEVVGRGKDCVAEPEQRRRRKDRGAELEGRERLVISLQRRNQEIFKA